MQKSILSKLYHGDITPVEQIVPNSIHYRDDIKSLDLLKKSFLQSLSCEQINLWNQVTAMEMQIHQQELEATFIEGFRISSQIQLESF